MANFEPVTTAGDLAELDADEVLEGYRDGRAGWSEPGGNRSRAYWHGWRNGAIDAGRLEKDQAAGELARVAAPGGQLSP